ncbi:unnamed protein product [Trichogramma brassicae]|uniref:RNase H type-1 domain-containing protein n=1 Tax=Trichogramma brassicae TaxID=86971 RepID=A0A6H5ITD3_9HYME|nr:unnamed protein product [Trichogramma brassicae]
MSLQSLNIGVKTNHVILDIKERLSALSHGSVSLAWIPSHIGIGGNETVDALARAATESPPASSPPVNFTDLAESFRRDCFTTSIAKCEADGLHKGKIYFDLFHRHEKSTPWFSGKNLPRSMIVTTNRIRSNHHSLAESLHRKNIIDNPGCACGSEEESLNHVLWNCGRYERQRRALWMELARLGLSAPLNAESIVAKPNLPAHKYIATCEVWALCPCSACRRILSFPRLRVAYQSSLIYRHPIFLKKQGIPLCISTQAAMHNGYRKDPKTTDPELPRHKMTTTIT